MAIISVTEGIAKLRAGNLVAIPTETVYGLAARIDDESALKQIFHVKERPFFDPLIVHVADTAQARRLSREWPEIYNTLTDAFWPGPLTLISPKAEAVSSLITAGLDSVGLRCPSHPVALQMLKDVGLPLAAPSANRFGRTSPTRAEHVEREFNGAVDVVDGGPSEIGVESTVVAATVDPHGHHWRVEILRPGGVARTQIKAVLDGAGYSFEVTRAESAAAPGQLKAHYQPSSPVVLVEHQAWNERLKAKAEAHFDRKFVHVQVLALGGSAQITARELYEKFREFSAIPDNLIVAIRTAENSGYEWEAIWDRIERAATLRL